MRSRPDAEQVSSQAAETVAGEPGVVVSEIRGADAKRDGDAIHVTGVDRNLSKTVEMAWTEGSTHVPGRLGRDGAFVTTATPRRTG